MTNQPVISVKEFVRDLTAGGGKNPLPADCITYGYAAGWLEEQDILTREEPLRRKTAARIIHAFLRTEQKEADEVDGSPAYCLKDLFDCRVCAGHMIQVYVKGIMTGRKTADGKWIFDGEAEVSIKEAEVLLRRIFIEKERTPKRILQEKKLPEPKQITREEALIKHRENRDSLLVDVRTEREFEAGRLEGAVNIPFMNLLKNPYTVSENCDKIIMLYCREGYQSRAAACCLLEAGYEQVSYFAWNIQEGKNNSF